MTYDAFLLASFGGPEGMEDVMPFLENVLRGKPVSEERKKEVAKHYELFGGVSPINAQNRDLISKIRDAFKKRNINLPVYWGNRNWNPYFNEALNEMKLAGHKSAIAFFTSAYSSYSGCRQYRENIAAAQEKVGKGAPTVEKLRVFFNHPLFIEANVAQILNALQQKKRQGLTDEHLIFTAHSIPQAMAATSDYEKQLQETSFLIAEKLNSQSHALVYQSRSGSPAQPWLGPDICEYLREKSQEGIKRVVIAPIGFISEHMEVIYDLDVEAKKICEELAIDFTRSATAGTHPLFIEMIVELVEEKLGRRAERRALGSLGPRSETCAPGCCHYAPSSRPKIDT